MADPKPPEPKNVETKSATTPPAAAPPTARTEPPPPAPIAAAAAPPASPASGGAGSATADADRALICGNPGTASSLLGDALGDDPAAALRALYRPRDAADGSARDALLGSLKDAQRLKAAVRTIRNELAATGCDWVMALDFTWTNAFGQARRRSSQLRLQLEASGGRARVKQIFGATGQ